MYGPDPVGAGAVLLGVGGGGGRALGGGWGALNGGGSGGLVAV